MPNPGSPIPLRRVTLNLYEEDCEFMQNVHATGWSTALREMLHEGIKDWKKQNDWPTARRTLGDLE